MHKKIEFDGDSCSVMIIKKIKCTDLMIVVYKYKGRKKYAWAAWGRVSGVKSYVKKA